MGVLHVVHCIELDEKYPGKHWSDVLKDSLVGLRTHMVRCKVKDKEEIERLKKALSATPGYEWQRAQGIMNAIQAVNGKGGLVVPRVCKVCKMYGHTRQYCPKKDNDEVARHERHMKRHEEYMRVEWLRMEIDTAGLCKAFPYHDKCENQIIGRCGKCGPSKEWERLYWEGVWEKWYEEAAYAEADARIRCADLLGDDAVRLVIDVAYKRGE